MVNISWNRDTRVLKGMQQTAGLNSASTILTFPLFLVNFTTTLTVHGVAVNSLPSTLSAFPRVNAEAEDMIVSNYTMNLATCCSEGGVLFLRATQRHPGCQLPAFNTVARDG